MLNQLVNNAAKIRYRWGGSVPIVVRMPWGGLRHAGPFHSQNTEPWFYRTAGLKIVVPSTPYDARALLAAAVADPDPVLASLTPLLEAGDIPERYARLASSLSFQRLELESASGGRPQLH